MSLLQSLAFLLSDMGFAQLALAFIVVGGYSLAINGSLSGAVRSGAGSAAFAAGVAFAALTPSWMSGVAFLALVVAAVAAFAGAAWLVSALLGLGAETGPVPIGEERAEAWVPTAQPARSLAPSAAVRSL
ncbi:MAG TPA: hypothetical protein VII31_05905 [Caldimonas sp.]|jgi:hypothetical protein